MVLYCQHAVREALESDSILQLPGFRVRQLVMPCSSKVEVRQVVKLLEKGVDGVQVVACPEEACRYLVGSNKAERRMDYVRILLEEIDFGPDRVGILRENGLTEQRLHALAGEMAERIRPLGPSPMCERKS